MNALARALMLFATLTSWSCATPEPDAQCPSRTSRLDPHGRACAQDCECQNLVYDGRCEQGICVAGRREPCSSLGVAKHCDLPAPLQGCAKGLSICERLEPQGPLQWSTCVAYSPGPEDSLAACLDGLDNDCDGLTDLEAPGCQSFCRRGQTRPCFDGPDTQRRVGVCRDGVQRCDDASSTWLACEQQIQPQPERCDGLDNDCDGLVDEGQDLCGLGQECHMGRCALIEPTSCVPKSARPCYDAAIDTLGVGPCQAGFQLCVPDQEGQPIWSRCVDALTPQAERCDGQDNDCDGRVDEEPDQRLCPAGAVCAQGLCQPQVNPDPDDDWPPGAQRACYEGPLATLDVGVCRAGLQTRSSDGQTWGPCQGQVLPSPEVCDGLDNDCDGLIDPRAALAPLAPACALTQGVCQGSVSSCGGALGWLDCSAQDYARHNLSYDPGLERCDRLDNDCDGQIDEGCGLGLFFDHVLARGIATAPSSALRRDDARDALWIMGNALGPQLWLRPSPSSAASRSPHLYSLTGHEARSTLLRLDGQGQPLCHLRPSHVATNTHQEGVSLRVDPSSGHAFWSGRFYNQLTLDGQSMVSNQVDTNNVFVAKVDPQCRRQALTQLSSALHVALMDTTLAKDAHQDQLCMVGSHQALVTFGLSPLAPTLSAPTPSTQQTFIVCANTSDLSFGSALGLPQQLLRANERGRIAWSSTHGALHVLAESHGGVLVQGQLRIPYNTGMALLSVERDAQGALSLVAWAPFVGPSFDPLRPELGGASIHGGPHSIRPLALEVHQGTLYVLAQLSGQVRLGSTTFQSRGAEDTLLLALSYDPSKPPEQRYTPLWHRQIVSQDQGGMTASHHRAQGRALSVDDQGRLWVTGVFDDHLGVWPSQAGFSRALCQPLYAVQLPCLAHRWPSTFILALDAQGQALWATSTPIQGSDERSGPWMVSDRAGSHTLLGLGAGDVGHHVIPGPVPKMYLWQLGVAP